MADVHEILIIGGSIAGVGLAHTLLKRSLPKSTVKFHVTMVSITPTYWWTLSAPRSLINNTLVPDSDTFADIAEMFKQYGDSFTFVHGMATSLDFTNKTVTTQLLIGDDNQPGGVQALRYDSLVIASGTRNNTALFRPGNSSKADQLAKLHEVRDALPNAKSIVIAGAGPVGVESAGEIGFEFGGAGKEITLVTNSKVVLPMIREDIGKHAEKLLEEVNVKVKHNVKLVSATPTTDGKTFITLSDDSTLTADVYIDATGLIPNNAFIPPDFLDDIGYLKVESTLRVPKANNVYAIGDIMSNYNRVAYEIGRQTPILANNILYDISQIGSEQKYEPYKQQLMLVPVGRKKGAGVLFGWSMFSFMVHSIKGKTLMLPMFKDQVSGKAF